jgi:hypothetical protein
MTTMTTTKKVRLITMICPTKRTVAFGSPGKPVVINEGLLRQIEAKAKFSRN